MNIPDRPFVFGWGTRHNVYKENTMRKSKEQVKLDIANEISDLKRLNEYHNYQLDELIDSKVDTSGDLSKYHYRCLERNRDRLAHLEQN